MLPTAKKLPSGKWRARAYDYTDADGKRHYVSFTSTSKAEAQAAARAHKPSLYNNKPTYLELTLSEAYKRYVDTHGNTLSPATVREYTRARDRDFPGLMGMKLKDITPELVQSAVNEDVLKYAPKTVRDKHGLLHRVLKLYAPHIILNTNLPRKSPDSVYVPTTEEVRAAMSTANDVLLVPILLASQGGLRREEICPLTKEDFTDFGVNVNKAMVKNENNKWIIKPPKTEAGIRFVGLPQDVIKKARNYDFSQLNPDKIEGYWQRQKKKYGYKFKFHAFRHYCASICHAKGVPDQYISKTLGHKDIQTTQRSYEHALRDKAPEFSKEIINIFTKEFSHKSHKEEMA